MHSQFVEIRVQQREHALGHVRSVVRHVVVATLLRAQYVEVVSGSFRLRVDGGVVGQRASATLYHTSSAPYESQKNITPGSTAAGWRFGRLAGSSTGADTKKSLLPRLEAHGWHGDGMQRVRSLAPCCFSPTACLQGSSKLRRLDRGAETKLLDSSGSASSSLSHSRDALCGLHTRSIAVLSDLPPPAVDMAVAVCPSERWCGELAARRVAERQTGAQSPR